MKTCARYLSLPSVVAILLFVPAAVNAASVNLIWTNVNTNSGPLAGISGNSVTLFPSQTATLTLDIQLNIDSREAYAVFLTFDFDTDLENEVNLISWSEFSWSNGAGTRNLSPFIHGIESSQESTGLQAGTIFQFDGTSIGPPPVNTTLTFARLVFVTNHGSVSTDGDDILTRGIIGGNFSTFSDAVLNGASVNIVPESGTVLLLGLGIGALALANRRRSRK